MSTRPNIDRSKFDPGTGEQIHDARGYEIPDPTPMQPPLGYKRQDTLAAQMRAMILSDRLAREAAAAGAETFEEADDFEIGDDFDEVRYSPYEANFDPMTPEERAALSTQGRDPDKILTKEEKKALEAPPPKPKKTSPAGDQPADVKGASSAGDPSGAEGEA